MDSPLKVSVGICTFRRPEGLSALVDGLARQRFAKVGAPELSLLVVDNDADPATAELGAKLEARTGLPVRVVPEPERGISRARNRVLDEVPGEADVVAFLDDDVVPHADWLDTMLFGLERTGADAISGQQQPAPDAELSGWLRDGRFFWSPRRERVGDHEDVAFGIMSNFVARAAFLREQGLRFREDLGLVGSEDKRFFDELRGRGGRMTWTSRAVVDHAVQAHRRRLGYQLRRDFRVGCGRGAVEMLSAEPASRKAVFVLRSAGKLVLNLLLLVPRLLLGLRREDRFERVKPLFHVVQMAGRVAGAAGVRYEQYRHDR